MFESFSHDHRVLEHSQLAQMTLSGLCGASLDVPGCV